MKPAIAFAAAALMLGPIVSASSASQTPIPASATEAVPAGAIQAGSAQAVPVQPKVSIAVSEAGFAPTPASETPTMDFQLSATPGELIAGWQVDIYRIGNERESSLSGRGAPPAILSWDGKENDGTPAPQGRYVAVLSADFGQSGHNVQAQSSPFVLDRAVPTGKILFSTERFSPIEGVKGTPLIVTIQGTSTVAKLDSWDVTVYDPGAMPFAQFSGRWPNNTIAWDGRGSSGDLVESAQDYYFVAKIRDAFGNVGEARGRLTTGIVLLKGNSRYRIGISSIIFKPDTANFKEVSTAQRIRNLETMRLLAKKLREFPGFTISIEGHAVLTNWNNKALAEREQRTSLIPLSKARAEAIKWALVKEYGFDAKLIKTVGLGAKDPVVPNSDLKNRWKNRRVEIYLEKDPIESGGS
ncbi:MAG TPA: OmpA family protein [Rectinemataceae bacterium]|nr:OmpA family protein [Rectinemataceae bacterium]